MKGSIPQVHLMPAGGITLDNVTPWLVARTIAVGIASESYTLYK